MKIRRVEQLIIRSKRLLICDPGFFFDSPDLIPSNSVCYNDFGGDGSFKVYSDGSIVVVDTSPRHFKAKSHPTFHQLQGDISVDTGHIAFIDADVKILRSTNQYNAFKLLVDVPNGIYKVWQEVKDTSQAWRDRILCFGADTTLLIHKPVLDDLQLIEEEIAQVLRLKGNEKVQRIKQIQMKLSQLHLSGVKAPRLKVLANAVKLKLPRISRKKKAT